MSRVRALELLDTHDHEQSVIPEADTDLTWWTLIVEIGDDADVLLSAMSELRDERWVTGSVTPIEATEPATGSRRVYLACVWRRLSPGEDQALRMQSQPMIVPQPNLGRRG